MSNKQAQRYLRLGHSVSVSTFLLLEMFATGCSGGAEQIETQAPQVQPAEVDSGAPRADATVSDAADPSKPHSDAKDDAMNTPNDPVKSAPEAARSTSEGTLAAGSSAGTEASSKATIPILSRVELRFIDSSVPPEYHRSYTINVQDGKVSTQVDVYGDVIATDVASVSESAWTKLSQSVPRDNPTPGDEGASGNTTYVLKIWQGKTQREFTWTSLSPSDTALSAAAAFAARVEALVPNLQALRDTEYSE